MTEGVERSVSDERDELRQLVTALRAHLEWHRDCGSTGFPRAAHPVREPTVSRDPPTAKDRAERGPNLEAVDLHSGRPTLVEGKHLDTGEPVAAADQGDRATELPSGASPVEPRPRVAGNEPRAPTPLLVVDQERLATAHIQLQAIRERVTSCSACRLHESRTQTVFSRGAGTSGLCFVGEGPGADEDAQGIPFVGAAGQLLDRMILAMGIARDDVYVCNIVKCRPPNNRKPEPDEMLACRPFLAEQLALLDPLVIVAMGTTALQGLLGTTDGITKQRGRWRLYQGRIAVMPTYHPAYLLRNPNAKREVWEDLQAVLRHLGRPIPEHKR